MTLGVETVVDEGSVVAERKDAAVGARLSTFDVKNRRSNGPRNRTFAIIKEVIDVTGALEISGGQDPSDISMPPYETSGTLSHSERRQVESPATVTITCRLRSRLEAPVHLQAAWPVAVS